MTMRPTYAPTRGIAPAPALLVAAVMVEVAVGIAAVVHPPGGGARAFVVAIGVAIGSVILVARSTLPQGAKAVAIVLLCAVLLALSASEDPFGIRSVGREMTVAQAPDPAASPDLAGQAATRPVTLRASGSDADASAAAADLSRRVDTGADASGTAIDGTLALTGPAGAPTYELNWSLVRAGQRMWCGRATVSAPTRAIALSQLESRMTDALARSRGAALHCV